MYCQLGGKNWIDECALCDGLWDGLLRNVRLLARY